MSIRYFSAMMFSIGFAVAAEISRAADVTYKFNIETSGYFNDTGSEPVPVNPINVAFDVTFDPSISNTGLPVTFVTAPPSAFSGLTLKFSNSATPATFDLQGVDGAESLTLQFVFNTGIITPGTYQAAAGSNDFGSYTFDSGSNLFLSQVPYFSSAGQVAISSAVPEPATWALMLIGFGGLGAMVRRRRSAAPEIKFMRRKAPFA